ncbi:alpha/beta hydrolase [Deinococcus pimensis]|uniref:alpha/beta hydrolase n=1 Tax=Deinococcus pimensis TaxID=309888 RepID=UPI0004B52904|nr:alpha/beta hydrolase [Deinococcus pimensis]
MRLRPLHLLTPLLAGLTVACSPVATLNTLARTNGLAVTQDVRYGPETRQVLDVYAPGNAKDAPVVMFVHGGSWTGGDKSDYRFVGESFARAGYVTVVMNYRLAPANRYPAYVQDAARAIRWTTDNVGAYGGDPHRLFVTGHSAGAFNAVEVVMNERWLREAGVPVGRIRGVVGIAGPYDYDFRNFPSRNAFPENADPEDVMPSRHVRRDPPPTLLLVAARDQLVGPENATRMEAALRAAGGDVTREVLPNLDHYTIVGSLSRTLTFLGPTRARVLDFIAARAKD